MPKKLNLAKYHYLDFSTAHINIDDLKLLIEDAKVTAVTDGPEDMRPAPNGAIVFGYDTGFFVHVPSDELAAACRQYRKAGYSKEFCRLIKLGFEQDCWLIRLDGDGEVIDGLKKFKW